MMTADDASHRGPVTVAVVGERGYDEALSDLLATGHYDSVIIETVDRAYSRIKGVGPQAIVLCVDVAEPRYFQLLSMLKLDRVTSGIPIVTRLSLPRHACAMDPFEFEPIETVKPGTLALN